jgi:hypothetical protein
MTRRRAIRGRVRRSRSAPRWRSDFGTSSWLLTGISALLVAMVALLALMNTIVIPLVQAAAEPLTARGAGSMSDRRHTARRAGRWKRPRDASTARGEAVPSA